jgi:prevent-host-death family protein
MRTAGVREARQDLTSLLSDVQRGREVIITDRGRPVARLVPMTVRRSFPDLKAVRRKVRSAKPQLAKAVLEDREDRP